MNSREDCYKSIESATTREEQRKAVDDIINFATSDFIHRLKEASVIVDGERTYRENTKLIIITKNKFRELFEGN